MNSKQVVKFSGVSRGYEKQKMHGTINHSVNAQGTICNVRAAAANETKWVKFANYHNEMLVLCVY